MPFCCRAWAVTAVTAMGTFCTFWAVFWAVTTTSSTVVCACARTGAARMLEAIMVDATSLVLNRFMAPPGSARPSGPVGGRLVAIADQGDRCSLESQRAYQGGGGTARLQANPIRFNAKSSPARTPGAADRQGTEALAPQGAAIRPAGRGPRRGSIAARHDRRAGARRSGGGRPGRNGSGR